MTIHTSRPMGYSSVLGRKGSAATTPHAGLAAMGRDPRGPESRRGGSLGRVWRAADEPVDEDEGDGGDTDSGGAHSRRFGVREGIALAFVVVGLAAVLLVANRSEFNNIFGFLQPDSSDGHREVGHGDPEPYEPAMMDQAGSGDGLAFDDPESPRIPGEWQATLDEISRMPAYVEFEKSLFTLCDARSHVVKLAGSEFAEADELRDAAEMYRSRLHESRRLAVELRRRIPRDDWDRVLRHLASTVAVGGDPAYGLSVELQMGDSNHE